MILNLLRQNALLNFTEEQLDVKKNFIQMNSNEN